MNTEKCNELVYKYGTTYGIYDMPKCEAEEMCKKLTEQYKNQIYDWHYVGGRVVVKVLDKNYKTPEQYKDFYDKVKLYSYRFAKGDCNRFDDMASVVDKLVEEMENE